MWSSIVESNDEKAHSENNSVESKKHFFDRKSSQIQNSARNFFFLMCFFLYVKSEYYLTFRAKNILQNDL